MRRGRTLGVSPPSRTGADPGRQAVGPFPGGGEGHTCSSRLVLVTSQSSASRCQLCTRAGLHDFHLFPLIWSSPQPSEGTAALLILQMMTLRVKGQAHGWDSDPAPKLCSELCTALPRPFPIPVVPTRCQGTAGASKVCAGGAAPGGGQVEGTVFPHSLSLLCPSFPGRPLSWGRARPRDDLDGASPLPLCRPGASAPVLCHRSPGRPLPHGSGE